MGGDSDAGDRWGPTATPTAADRLTAVRARGAGGGAERQREAAGNGETARETQTEKAVGKRSKTGGLNANHAHLEPLG